MHPLIKGLVGVTGVALATRVVDAVMPPKKHVPPPPQPGPPPPVVKPDFTADAKRVLGEIRDYVATLSARDQLMMRLGMRAAHLEEALAAGDFKRAEAHLEALAKLASSSSSTAQ